MSITINGNGTIGGITAGGLPDGTVTRDDLAATAKGSILQVKETFLNTSFSVPYTVNTITDVTNVSVSLTPAATTSKVLVYVRINFETDNVNTHSIFLI